MVGIKDFMEKQEIIVYHGSRGGLEGDIIPASRVKCDFGKGFYMGTNPEQVKGLVVEDAMPVFYTLRIDLEKIGRDRILVLDGMQWVYTIMASRGKVQDFLNLDVAKKAVSDLQKFDLVVGAIADDRMNEAMYRYSVNGLTDKGLLACLESVDYGYQVVAKTERACRSIEVVSSRDIYGQEADSIRQYVREKRMESRNIVDQMAREHIRDGKYLTELIDSQNKLQKNNVNLRRGHGR